MKIRLLLVLAMYVTGCGTGPDIVSMPPPPDPPPAPPPPPPPPQPPPPPAPPSPFEEFGSASLWVFPSMLNDSGEAVGVAHPRSHVMSSAVVFRHHVLSFIDSTRGIERAVVDNRGRIAAVSWLAGEDRARLSVWDASGEQSTALPSFSFMNILALQINANGAVLFVDSLNERWHTDSVIGRVSMIYRGGTVERLGSLHSKYRSTRAYAINDQGQVVGRSAALFRTTDAPYSDDGKQVYHPFIWEDGRLRDLGVFGLAEEPCNWTQRRCAEGAALDINNRGQVVGYSEDSVALRRPFIWQDGVMSDLGAFPGRSAVARLINDRGMVAGDNDTLGFVWENGVTTTFSLGGGATRIMAMNERGDVAGTGITTDGRQHAFVWRSGQIIDLGIPLEGACAATPVDINERGEVLIDVSMTCDTYRSPLTRFTGNMWLKQRAVIWHPPTP